MRPIARLTLCSLLPLVLATSLAPVSAGGPVLARVNDEAIDLDLIKKEFEARHMGHMSMIGEQETLDTFLQSAIRRRLFVQEARRLGLQNDPDLRAAADARRVELLADWLYKTEVIGKVVVSEAAIDKAVAAQRSWREIVLIQTDTETQAIDARNRIQGNATPQDVARQLSKARSASRGGLEPVAWGDKEPALETAIFASKPGDLTPPVRVEEGWALAKVLAERKTEGIPDAQMRLKAKNVLEARARDTRRAAYLESLRVRYKAAVVESLLEPETLLASLDPKPGAPKDDRSVAAWDGGKITLSEFAAGIRDESFRSLRPTQQRLHSQYLLSDRLDQELIRREALRRQAEAPGSVKAGVTTFEDDLIFRMVLDRVVFKDLTVTDAEIHAFYEEHQSEYVVPVQVKLAVALLATEDEGKKLLADARAGQDFAVLARERSRDRTTAIHGGVAGWVSRDKAIEPLREIAFDPKIGLGGPVQSENGWLVFKVVDRREGRQKTETEVKEQVRQSVLEQKGMAHMRDWDDKLRASSTITVDKAAVTRAVVILREEQAAKLKLSQEKKAAAKKAGAVPQAAHP